MERVTISLKSELARQFDEFIEARGYSNRSEAMRDLIRERLESERLEEGEESFCIAIVSYIFNHHELDLPGRLAARWHSHHDLAVSTMRVALDHDNCLETVFLRGPTTAVRGLADSVIAERGVRHGKIHMVPVELGLEDHAHAWHNHQHIHSHLRT